MDDKDPRMQAGTTVEASLLAQAARMRAVETEIVKLREERVKRDEFDSRFKDYEDRQQRGMERMHSRIDQLWDDRNRSLGRRSVMAAGWATAGGAVVLGITVVSRNLDWIIGVVFP